MRRTADLCALLVALLAAAGCASIEVEAQQLGPLDAASYRTWDWIDASSTASPAPIAELRSAVERELSARGLQRLTAPEVDLLLDLDVSVETRTRQQDPYFNMYSVVRYEVGTLTLEVWHPESGELLWTGSGQSELRITAVPESSMSTRLVDTDSPRDWKVARKVSKLLNQLPRALFAEDAAAAP